MSLYCAECKEGIEYGTPLHSVKTKNGEIAVAICASCFAKIPEEEKKELKKGERQITICEADSTCNYNWGNVYNWTDFRTGRPLFSISNRAAKRFIPVITKEYL